MCHLFQLLISFTKFIHNDRSVGSFISVVIFVHWYNLHFASLVLVSFMFWLAMCFDSNSTHNWSHVWSEHLTYYNFQHGFGDQTSSRQKRASLPSIHKSQLHDVNIQHIHIHFDLDYLSVRQLLRILYRLIWKSLCHFR